MEVLTLMVDGGIASCGAAVFSNPFEVMKTRLQLQGELQKRGEYTVQYRGMLHGLVKVAQTEGFLALQKGLVASFCHQAVQNSVRLGIYPTIRLTMEQLMGASGFLMGILAGAIAGAISAVISSPFFLVKTRLQAESKVKGAVGEQHHYRGVGHALSSIYRANGVKGLFQGVTTACWRTSIGSAAQLATYDSSKAMAVRWLQLPDRDMRVHFAAAASAALAITVTMNPFDVVMTRSYNAKTTERYAASTLGAMLQVLRIEGLEGLYKGSVALWSRTAPHTIMTFLFLEQFRNLRIPNEAIAVEG